MKFIRGHNSVGMDRSKPWKMNRYEIRDCGYSSPCWLWQLKVTTVGYGSLSVGGKEYLAHRWYYEQVNGPIAPGLQIDHLCRQKTCVNPDHMEAVSHMTNSRRANQWLTDDQVDQICIRRREGETVRGLAYEFRVSKETIRLIGINGPDKARRAHES